MATISTSISTPIGTPATPATPATPTTTTLQFQSVLQDEQTLKTFNLNPEFIKWVNTKLGDGGFTIERNLIFLYNDEYLQERLKSFRVLSKPFKAFEYYGMTISKSVVEELQKTLGPRIYNRDISKRIAEMWDELPEESKKPFEQQERTGFLNYTHKTRMEVNKFLVKGPKGVYGSLFLYTGFTFPTNSELIDRREIAKNNTSIFSNELAYGLTNIPYSTDPQYLEGRDVKSMRPVYITFLSDYSLRGFCYTQKKNWNEEIEKKIRDGILDLYCKVYAEKIEAPPLRDDTIVFRFQNNEMSLMRFDNQAYAEKIRTRSRIPVPLTRDDIHYFLLKALSEI